jgi:hypothetical protein
MRIANSWIWKHIPTLGFWCCAVLVASLTVQGQAPPRYRVDPFWPRELPNNWIVGQIGGMAVDKNDHIWVFQRPGTDSKDELAAAQTPPVSQCCFPAPSVLEFDTKGNLIKSWGSPGFVPDWFASEHAIFVDKDENVWLGGNAPTDRHILKFTNDGKKQLLEIGHPSKDTENNQDTSILGSPAGFELDEGAHEAYIADGYMNKRVVVYDSNTGAFKRGWGAYGIPLSQIDNGAPPPYVPSASLSKQFRNPVHCAHLSVDGFVYVCDRSNDRIQVFTKQGQFVREFRVKTDTLGNGSVYGLVFSHDSKQKYLLIVDGENNVVWILNRSDGAVVGSFGHRGRNAGQFHHVHQMVMDSHGNVYTGEVDNGKRIQKFILMK